MKAQQALNRAEKIQAAQAVGRDHKQPKWFAQQIADNAMLERILNLAPSNTHVMMNVPGTNKLYFVEGQSDPDGPDVHR